MTDNVSNIAFDCLGKHVDLKYVWPISAEHLRNAVAQDVGLLDTAMVQLMMRIVRPGDTVVDGGASIGYFTVLLAKLVGPDGLVYAIEPDSNSLLFLHRNLEENGLENVIVRQRALWSEDELITKFYLSEFSHGNSMSPQEPGSWPVLVTTTMLYHYLPARLVKLDIEGSEEHALRTIFVPEEAPYIICELNNVALPRFGTSSVKLREMMYKRGYETYLISDEGKPVLLTPYEGVAVNRTDINVLFSTPEYVQELL